MPATTRNSTGPSRLAKGIGEAMGVIMNRYKISGGQAFEVLKRVSQHRNVKLREVAQEVAETGEVPGAEDR
ncbi:AmiR/NasT family two-component response regulator [Saccharopolyspora lacisalsi]|uniref:AmiR/NasT family two-component response regulator n=1 Tax=Halosaccharopolyspora lacisalsi TaxID=1000566 RepID=A0A839DZT2_9PSEU|nr:ANTAR domain-containing protein [Halosaccharopolyspora lacisalsi]MBA8827452.1 AmiR/NasT family two-component response regulator [Halosaccharopolyspora lacisalsi]